MNLKDYKIKLKTVLEENPSISLEEKAYLLENIDSFNEQELEELIQNNT